MFCPLQHNFPYGTSNRRWRMTNAVNTSRTNTRFADKNFSSTSNLFHPSVAIRSHCGDFPSLLGVSWFDNLLLLQNISNINVMLHFHQNVYEIMLKTAGWQMIQMLRFSYFYGLQKMWVKWQPRWTYLGATFWRIRDFF